MPPCVVPPMELLWQLTSLTLSGKTVASAVSFADVGWMEPVRWQPPHKRPSACPCQPPLLECLDVHPLANRLSVLECLSSMRPQVLVARPCHWQVWHPASALALALSLAWLVLTQLSFLASRVWSAVWGLLC